MNDSDLLALYLQENFPSILESSITDPELREIWLNKAKAWYKDMTSSGFRHALVEFRAMQGLRHWSRETTLKQAREAFRRAGMMDK